MSTRFLGALLVLIAVAASGARGADKPASPAPASAPVAVAAPAQPQGAAPRLPPISSWGYQLQKANPAEIAQSPYDLVVIDYSRNGTDKGRFRPEDVKAMQKKPDGGRRIVLAYLSVGEAEEYRYYWRRQWVEAAPFKDAAVAVPSAPVAAGVPPAAAAPPPETVRIPKLVAPGWLGRENTAWSGNFLVRYWHDGWRDIIFGGEDSYLSRIQEAGFDGVFLDRVDAFYTLERDRPDAMQMMVDLVVALAAKAREKNPAFVVLPQNGEELLRQPAFLAVIDGIAKEDLLYGHPVQGQPTAPGTIANSSARLARAQAAGLPVLVVEYLDDPALRSKTAGELRASGFVPYFGPRTLDRLDPPPVAEVR